MNRKKVSKIIDFQSEANDEPLFDEEGHSNAGEEFEDANGESDDTEESEGNKKK